MNYDKLITRGCNQGDVWDAIHAKCFTHADFLAEIETRRRELDAYAKSGISFGAKTGGVDEVQKGMVGHLKLLETFAWRVYMFGSRSRFSVKPGPDGELRKRVRNDRAFHKLLAEAKRKYGPPGFMYDEHGFNFDEASVIQLRKRPCLMPNCTHKGVIKALKNLKMTMHQEWEQTFLKRAWG